MRIPGKIKKKVKINVDTYKKKKSLLIVLRSTVEYIYRESSIFIFTKIFSKLTICM